jgi:cytochrome c-type biogenesis protein CcmH/NrfF
MWNLILVALPLVVLMVAGCVAWRMQRRGKFRRTGKDQHLKRICR